MAKLKRYDLYEGDDEFISSSLPGKKPLGRDEGLRERDAYDRRKEEEAEKRRRYFAANEKDDGLGAPSSVFDDFDRFEQPIPIRDERPKYRRREKHWAAWTVTAVFCLLLLAAMGIAVLPQLTGIRYRFLPNLAFANGNLIRLDGERQDAFDLNRREIYNDRIYPGVYIDNVQVGGMTKGEAAEAVRKVHEDVSSFFDIVIAVGNENWHVNSERVPVSRNIEEVVEKAFASGRGNSASLAGNAATPFEERVSQASAMRSNPVTFATKQDYDHEALRALTDGIVNYVNRDPVNSTVHSFDFKTQTFTFTDDRPGARIDPDDLYSRVAELLDDGVTKKELRIGEIFSFNAATGERTAAKGYQEAPAISGGQSKDEVGGGVCQTSSTLFNAVARADLEIIERNPHAWPSHYIEKGFDATVNWPGLDFKFKNNTEWPVFIIAGYSKRKVTVNIYGMSLGSDVRIDLESEVVRTIPKPEGTNYVINTSLAPGESKKTVTGRQGYEVNTWKVWYQGNREIKREILFKTTYRAYQETIEYNPK